MTPQHKIALLVRDLVFGPATLEALVKSSGLERRSVQQWLDTLHAVDAVHICAWERIGGRTLPVYGFNPDGKPDKPRPPQETPAERQARYRHRKRVMAADPEARLWLGLRA